VCLFVCPLPNPRVSLKVWFSIRRLCSLSFVVVVVVIRCSLFVVVVLVICCVVLFVPSIPRLMFNMLLLVVVAVGVRGLIRGCLLCLVLWL